MNEQDLRALVRDAVARHLGGAIPSRPEREPRPHGEVPHTHASHSLYIELVNVGDACVIEPAVKCDHCGYCKSHGH